VASKLHLIIHEWKKIREAVLDIGVEKYKNITQFKIKKSQWRVYE